MTLPDEMSEMSGQYLAVRELPGNPVPSTSLPLRWRESVCLCGCPDFSETAVIVTCFPLWRLRILLSHGTDGASMTQVAESVGIASNCNPRSWWFLVGGGRQVQTPHLHHHARQGLDTPWRPWQVAWKCLQAGSPWGPARKRSPIGLAGPAVFRWRKVRQGPAGRHLQASPVSYLHRVTKTFTLVSSV